MFKKFITFIIAFVLLAAPTSFALADQPTDTGDKGKPVEPGENGKSLQLGHQKKSSEVNNVSEPPGLTKKGETLTASTEKGFDESGYNRTARIFNGTGLSWCMDKYHQTTDACKIIMGPYANDKLVMKWNSEWDRGNNDGWTDNQYDAWLNNQWNGMVPGGSGEVWHYKFVWVGPCTDGEILPEGGYCIWGQFQVIMSHGVVNGEHDWDSHAAPTGYGAYPIFP